MLAKSVDQPAAGGGGGGGEDFILIRDEKPSGTAGGTSTAGTWQTRDLNTIASDAGGHASILSNQITLAAGTYRVRARLPGFRIEQHKGKLYNISDAVDVVIGSSAICTFTSVSHSQSYIEGRFTITASKIFELQHRSAGTLASFGFGAASSFGVIEVYSEIEFWKAA